MATTGKIHKSSFRQTLWSKAVSTGGAGERLLRLLSDSCCFSGSPDECEDALSMNAKVPGNLNSGGGRRRGTKSDIGFEYKD